MDLEDNAMGLTHDQTDKILQFQDLTGIEDMSVCRDVLQRHQWDLEVSKSMLQNCIIRVWYSQVANYPRCWNVQALYFRLQVAIQEQLNIREGRPSVFATEARAPPVVHDHVAQQVFTDEPPEGPGGVRGLFQYVVNLVVSVCYNTISSVLNLLLSFIRHDDRRCKLFIPNILLTMNAWSFHEIFQRIWKDNSIWLCNLNFWIWKYVYHNFHI